MQKDICERKDFVFVYFSRVRRKTVAVLNPKNNGDIARTGGAPDSLRPI